MPKFNRLTNAKAEDLFDFYNHTPDVYKAVFEQRFDLQLYQKIKFVGFDKISEEEMRITEIKYFMGARKPDGPLIKQVDIGFTSDKQLSDLIALEKSMSSDFLSEVRKMIREVKTTAAQLAVGTVTEIDGNEATVQLEKDGSYVKVRLINQG